MIGFVSTYAWRVDEWLKDHVGRPYNIILLVALIEGISASINAIEKELGHTGNLVQIAITVSFDALLVVNQLAQLHEHRKSAKARREAREAAKKDKAPHS